VVDDTVVFSIGIHQSEVSEVQKSFICQLKLFHRLISAIENDYQIIGNGTCPVMGINQVSSSPTSQVTGVNAVSSSPTTKAKLSTRINQSNAYGFIGKSFVSTQSVAVQPWSLVVPRVRDQSVKYLRLWWNQPSKAGAISRRSGEREYTVDSICWLDGGKPWR
jgi:hypothetical protein